MGEAVAKQLGEGNYLPMVGAAIEKLDDLVRFVGQVRCRTPFFDLSIVDGRLILNS